MLDPGLEGSLEVIRRFSHYKLANRILWGIWRRLPEASQSRTFPFIVSSAYADWLTSNWIPATDVFHAWAGRALTSLPIARRHGAITILENPTMHPLHWQQAVLQECATFNVRPRDCRAVLPSALIQRMEREYKLCDFIIVPSSIARDSFERAGHIGKIIVVHACVDHLFFTPPHVPALSDIFRVCYTGRVELSKGIIYLLQAWKQLNLPNAELVLMGEVAPEMQPFLREYVLPNVRLTGFISPTQIADYLRASRLFVFPSVNEGLARVPFEAMSSGLPIVATQLSGAEDCLTPNVEGNIVPARDPLALAEAIKWHFDNPEASAAMGRAARIKVEKHFTIPHYVERMIDAYHFTMRQTPPTTL